MSFFEEAEGDWDHEISWDTLALVLQRNPTPPPSRGITSPPSVTINRDVYFIAEPLPPNHLRIFLDTSVVSLILDGCVFASNPAQFFGYFPGLRQVVGDVGLRSQPAKVKMLQVPKIRRSILTYKWFKTRSWRKPVATISITKTIHGELMSAIQYSSHVWPLPCKIGIDEVGSVYTEREMEDFFTYLYARLQDGVLQYRHCDHYTSSAFSKASDHMGHPGAKRSHCQASFRRDLTIICEAASITDAELVLTDDQRFIENMVTYRHVYDTLVKAIERFCIKFSLRIKALAEVIPDLAEPLVPL